MLKYSTYTFNIIYITTKWRENEKLPERAQLHHYLHQSLGIIKGMGLYVKQDRPGKIKAPFRFAGRPPEMKGFTS